MPGHGFSPWGMGTCRGSVPPLWRLFGLLPQNEPHKYEAGLAKITDITENRDHCPRSPVRLAGRQQGSQSLAMVIAADSLGQACPAKAPMPCDAWT